jgi:hypothetical protein
MAISRLKNTLLISGLVLMMIASCQKDEKINSSPSVKLSFSADTIIFDTVFTTIGSITKEISVYNKESEKIVISSINLAGGNNSRYSINVDGVPGTHFNDVEIGPNDSIFVFARVNINPGDADLPFIVTDSIVFETNGNIQDVDLVAWGQNANFILWDTNRPGLPKYKIVAAEGVDTTWTKSLPIVVYGYAVVDSTGSLTIEPGTKVHFHSGSGLKYNDFEKGMILTKIILPEIKLLDVVLELFPGNQRVGIWSQMIFHTGNFSSKARIHLLNKNEINGSETAFAQIHLEKPAILLNRDRFVIRNTSNDLTIGGGIIIDNRPLHHKKRTKTLSRYLETLAQATTDHENLSALILLELNKSALPLTTETIASTLNKTINEVENAILDVELQSAILVYENKNYLIPKAFIEKNNKRIIETLKVWHLQNPLSESGLELREIAGKVKIMGDFNIYMLGKILEKMTFEKVIRTVGATFVLKEHKVSFDRKTQEQIIWLEEIIRDSGMQRATINEVEAIALTRNIKKGQLVKLLQYLAANDKIFFNGEDILHNSLVRKIRLKLLQNLSENPRGINEKEFRLLVDGTKRVIQALVNLFVQEGIIEKQTFYLLITEKGKELLL